MAKRGFHGNPNTRVEVEVNTIGIETDQHRRRIRMGPPEHECLKFMMMMMTVAAAAVVEMVAVSACVLLRAT